MIGLGASALHMRFGCGFLRFNLCCHDLEVELRLGRHRIYRFCQLCSRAVVDDEKHMVFECLAVLLVRAQYNQLFLFFSRLQDNVMRSFMGQSVEYSVMKIVQDGLYRDWTMMIVMALLLGPDGLGAGL